MQFLFILAKLLGRTFLSRFLFLVRLSLILYTTHDVILIFHLVIFVLCTVVMRSRSSRHENCPI